MRRLIGAAAFACLSALPVSAQGYFEGKTITYIIATSPGGGYDTYARAIGKHLRDKLGADKVLFKNLPGAGHIIGATTLYSSDPDGLTIGTFNTGLIYAQILGQDGVEFDLNDFSWIGKAASDPRVVVLSTGSGFDNFEALMASPNEVNFAASGIGSASYNETKMLIDGLELNAKIIPGFNGNEGEMAMLRSEVVGQIGSQSSLQSFVDAGNGYFAAGIGGDVDPQLISFARTDKAKAIVNLIDALSNLARLTAAPPGTDPAVLDELRDAYMAVMADPAFLEEATKLGIPIDPARGDEVAELVSAALSQTDETVAIISAALSSEETKNEIVASKILTLEDRNKIVGFTGPKGDVTGEISGSRTTVTLNGAPAERGDLAVGMDCAFEYAPADPIEFVAVTCGDGAAAAAAGGMMMVSSKILALGDGGKAVTFQAGDAEKMGEVSGSRTALTIDGAEAKRDALVVGMTCDFGYEDGAEIEFKTVACTSN